MSMLAFSPGDKLSVRFIQRAVALSTAMLLLLHGANAKSLSEATAQTARGIISFTGTVRINGQSALAGQTLFANSLVVTLAHSGSLIALSNLAKLNLSENTGATVDSSKTSLSVILWEGRIVSSVPAGVLADFTTADLSIKTDATEPVVFKIETTECGGTDIFVSTGHLETRRAGQLLTIRAGEAFSTAARSAAKQPGHPALSRKRTAGLFVGIGAALAVMLAVALGNNDEDQENPGDVGGCIIVPSPGAPNGCS